MGLGEGDPGRLRLTDVSIDILRSLCRELERVDFLGDITGPVWCSSLFSSLKSWTLLTIYETTELITKK